MLFTINLQHWQKAVRTMRACFAVALDTQMKHRGVRAKVFSWTILRKWKLMLKVSYITSLQIRLTQQMVQWKISIACTVIIVYLVAKSKRTNIVSTKNLSQHFECLVKMRATSNYSVSPCQHWGDWKRGNGKRETEKWQWKTRNRHALTNSTFNKNICHILPVPLSLKLSIRHFAINVVIMSYSLKK